MWQIRALTGQDRGRLFSIVPPCEVTVGRDHPAVSLGLEDPSVSRFHARLLARGEDGLVVTDLGSANGSYVNGQAIGLETALRDGDLLFLGSVTLRIERVERVAKDVIPLRPEGRPLGERHAVISTTMRGSLAEISTPVVLRLLGVTKKTCGLLLTRRKAPGEALVVFRKGQIVSVAVDRVRARTGDEGRIAIASLMAWEGEFEIGPAPSSEDDSMLLNVDDVIPAAVTASDRDQGCAAPPNEA